MEWYCEPCNYSTPSSGRRCSLFAIPLPSLSPHVLGGSGRGFPIHPMHLQQGARPCWQHCTPQQQPSPPNPSKLHWAKLHLWCMAAMLGPGLHLVETQIFPPGIALIQQEVAIAARSQCSVPAPSTPSEALSMAMTQP